MARLRPRESPTFTKSEIEQMEKLLKETGNESSNQNFCDKVAKKFNRDPGRAGKPVQWTQVQNWFQSNNQDSTDVVILSAIPPKVVVSAEDGVIPNLVPETSPVPTGTVDKLLTYEKLSNGKLPTSEKLPTNDELPTSDKLTINEKLPTSEKLRTSEKLPTSKKLPDISELEFEAKSSKDGAWYDVSLFLTHRVLGSGESEVRVRFVGFGAEEDEWVNVKKAVRERSIPLEASECHRVKVGDHVLCFQEREDQAIHYDARVLEVERKIHDIRGCRCIFLVRYDYDNSKEKVRLRRLCRRPSPQI